MTEDHVMPSPELISGLKALYDKATDVWNLAIDERIDAPLNQKRLLRRTAEVVEKILVNLETLKESLNEEL